MAARNFAPITIEDLMAKIQEFDGERELIEHLGDDIKVEFDLENTDDNGGLCGYHTEPNGLTYYGCSAGGDWENPVFFMVYWDGKRLRGYVPTEGNPWNTTTKQAYGNDEDADAKNIRKRYPELLDPEDKEYTPDTQDVSSDENLIKADFMARILPIGQKEAKPIKVVGRPAKNPPPRPKDPLSAAKQEIDRLRGLLQEAFTSLETIAQSIDYPQKF